MFSFLVQILSEERLENCEYCGLLQPCKYAVRENARTKLWQNHCLSEERQLEMAFFLVQHCLHVITRVCSTR